MLTVRLWMGHRSIIGLYPIFDIKILDSLIVELGAIIYNKGVWNPKFTQDEVIEEISNLLFRDLRHSFSFDPLRKVVASNYYILLLTS